MPKAAKNNQEREKKGKSEEAGGKRGPEEKKGRRHHSVAGHNWNESPESAARGRLTVGREPSGPKEEESGVDPDESQAV